MFNKSVASITKNLTKMVRDLRAHADTMEARADILAAELIRLREDRNAALDESAKATITAAKIAALVE